MPYASIMRARPEPRWRRGAEEVVRQIISLHMMQAGSLFQGMSGVTSAGEIVILGLWRDRETAACAAAHPQVRRLRAQLAPLCEEPPQEEGHDLSGGARVKELSDSQVA